MLTNHLVNTSLIINSEIVHTVRFLGGLLFQPIPNLIINGFLVIIQLHLKGDVLKVVKPFLEHHRQRSAE
jgi:hypothetical protein